MKLVEPREGVTMNKVETYRGRDRLTNKSGLQTPLIPPFEYRYPLPSSRGAIGPPSPLLVSLSV